MKFVGWERGGSLRVELVGVWFSRKRGRSLNKAATGLSPLINANAD